MKKYVLICLCALGCADKEARVISNLNNEAVEIESLSQVWVCNHPHTNFHNKVCIEETFPNGCFIPGDSSKFCWLLTYDDCKVKDESIDLDVCRQFFQETSSIN
jgi:hypothetical protein